MQKQARTRIQCHMRVPQGLNSKRNVNSSALLSRESSKDQHMKYLLTLSANLFFHVSPLFIHSSNSAQLWSKEEPKANWYLEPSH